ncbi:hypothetical protein GCK32_005556 [Trichostrongylus colubriformis]|uniref:Uncharacterized protein n=1 Tax=Trichostrongylus colubriformis TaxID=6319 RepID=A0AAN8FTG3_TRICO
MTGFKQQLDESMYALLIYFRATFYLLLLLQSCGLITLGCSRRKEANEKNTSVSRSKEAKTQEASTDSSEMKLQNTQREDAIVARIAKTLVAKTQDSPPSSDKMKTGSKGKKKKSKKRKDKLFSSTDRTTNSIKQSKRLPRAPKGQHEEELEEMEMILDEQSKMQKLELNNTVKSKDK